MDLSTGILWYRLDALQQASRDFSIPLAFKQRLEDVLRSCQKALENAKDELNKVNVDSRTGKVAYALFRNRKISKRYQSFKALLDELDKICSQLHELQTGPSSAFLRPESFKIIHETYDHQPGAHLPLSDIWVAQGNYQTGQCRVTADFILEPKYRENDIRTLCNKFMDAKMARGTVKCLGYRQPPYNELEPPYRPFYQMVFQLPECERHSLAYLIDCETPPVISRRLELARKICRALLQFHENGLIHKALRPRTILLLQHKAGESSLEEVHLLGWTYVREVNGATSQRGDNDWKRNIYQHPERQGGPGNYPEVAYETRHELYSLGVTLLELFLWMPFIERVDRSVLTSAEKICQDFEARGLRIGEAGGGLPERYAGNTIKLTSRPASTRRIWLELASQELSSLNDEVSVIIRKCIEGTYTTINQVSGDLDEIHVAHEHAAESALPVTS